MRHAALTIAAAGLFMAAGCSPSPDAAEDGAGGRAVDLENGARQFLKCRACHTLDAGEGHSLGPNLHGVFGRRAGGLEDYDYSPTLARVGFRWTEDRLDRWLADPRGYLPGSSMAFVGVRDPRDRADLIAYLKEVTAPKDEASDEKE